MRTHLVRPGWTPTVASAAFASGSAASRDSRNAAMRLSREIMQATSAASVLALVGHAAQAPRLDERHCAAALVRIAKLASRGRCAALFDEDALARLVLRTQSLLDRGKLQGRQLANLLWAAAPLQTAQTPALQTLTAEAVRHTVNHLGQMAPQELAITTWSLAVMRLLSEADLDLELSDGIQVPLRHELCARLSDCRGHGFRPQELCNISWAFAPTLLGDAPVMQALAACAVQHTQEFNVQRQSSLMWSLAPLRSQSACSLIVPALHHVPAASVHRYDAQALATVAWAYVVLHIEDEQFHASVAATAVRRLHEATPQGLVLLAGACASLPRFQERARQGRARVSEAPGHVRCSDDATVWEVV